jgi:acyl-CoA thioester hydrolase
VHEFEFVHHETVRFRDLDPMGHVNNAVFLTYMESARTAYLLETGAASGLHDIPIIVARVELDFRSPAELGEEIAITVRPGRFGTKSFELEYELRADGRLVAEGKSVCVGYDYDRRETVAIPGELRRRLEGVAA